MRTSRKVVLASLASAVVLALAIPVFTGALNARAAMGLSDDVDIFITEPGSAIIEVNVFTEGGAAPSSLPIFVEALVDLVSRRVDVAARGDVTFVLDGVDFALNGTLDADARTLTDADDVAVGVEFVDTRGGEFSEWEGTLDLASGTFEAFPTRGNTLDPTLVSTNVMRAFVSISSTYDGYRDRAPGNVTGWDDFDAIIAFVNVFDAADGDLDGNGKPDAGVLELPSGTFEGTSPDGNVVITTWVPLVANRGAGTTELELVLDGGAVVIDVNAPTLASLKLWETISMVYDSYDEGRLVLSVAGDPIDLLDGPTGVDPISEFDTAALGPMPENIFMLVNVLLRDNDLPAPKWVAIDVLPLFAPRIEVELSGTEVAAGLTVGDTVLAYSYDTTFSHDFGTGALTDVGDVMDWDPADSTVLARDIVEAGDSSIFAGFSTASIIVGSNAAPVSPTLTPVVGGGGGSSGICFIATAAYGTPLADEINVLRGLRDSYMLNNMVGAAFVDTYYRLSPPVADVVAHNAFAKALVRTLLVPIVMLSGFVLALPGATAALLLVAFAFAAYRLRRKMTRS